MGRALQTARVQAGPGSVLGSAENCLILVPFYSNQATPVPDADRLPPTPWRWPSLSEEPFSRTGDKTWIGIWANSFGLLRAQKVGRDFGGQDVDENTKTKHERLDYPDSWLGHLNLKREYWLKLY